MIEGKRKNKSGLSFQQVRKMHPYQTMLYFAMIASGFLFLVMLGLYIAQRFSSMNSNLAIQLPKWFVISTIALIGSGYSITQARKSLLNDQLKRSVNLMLVTSVMGFLFTGFQLAGWVEFYNNGYHLQSGNVASLYIYVLTFIHLIHVFIGFVFLGYVLIPAYKKSRNMVDELIWVTNPYQKRKMNLLTFYWHYMDAVWMILFFAFLLTA